MFPIFSLQRLSQAGKDTTMNALIVLWLAVMPLPKPSTLPMPRVVEEEPMALESLDMMSKRDAKERVYVMTFTQKPDLLTTLQTLRVLGILTEHIEHLTVGTGFTVAPHKEKGLKVTFSRIDPGEPPPVLVKSIRRIRTEKQVTYQVYFDEAPYPDAIQSLNPLFIELAPHELLAKETKGKKCKMTLHARIDSGAKEARFSYEIVQPDD
jgi:hypothetical protein